MGKKIQVRSHKFYLMSEPQELKYQIVTSQSLPLEWLVPRGINSKPSRKYHDQGTRETTRKKEIIREGSTDNSLT